LPLSVCPVSDPAFHRPCGLKRRLKHSIGELTELTDAKATCDDAFDLRACRYFYFEESRPCTGEQVANSSVTPIWLQVGIIFWNTLAGGNNPPNPSNFDHFGPVLWPGLP